MKKAPYDGYYKYDREVARTYEQSRKNERHWRQEDRFVGLYLQNRHVEDLLDLPVGTGRFFKHYHSIRSVTGVDISQEMLAKAKEQLILLPQKVAIRLEQSDVSSLPFNDAAFDTVIVFRLFHLMPQIYLDSAIKELCRVCRRDVVAQTYSPIKKNYYTLFHRLGRILRKYTYLINQHNQSTPTVLPVKPWSHIRAYYHEQNIIDAMFSKYGFRPSTSTLLDTYENTEVRATVYSRTI